MNKKCRMESEKKKEENRERVDEVRDDQEEEKKNNSEPNEMLKAEGEDGELDPSLF